MRPSKVLKSKGFLLALSLIFSLSLIELFMRLYFGCVVREIDPLYLYKPVPNASKTYRHSKANGGAKIHSEINSQGFRGEEFKNNGNSKRIIVYGDSFINAEFSTLQDTFVKKLEKGLHNRTGLSVEAINAGVVGYGPDQICLRIHNEVSELNPDLVICAIFADNDFGDLLRNKIYRLDRNQNLIKADYVISNKLRWELAAKKHFRTLWLIPKAYSIIEWKLSNYFGLSNPGEINLCRDEYEDYMQNNIITNLFHDHYDEDIAFDLQCESSQYKIRLMERIIFKIKKVFLYKDIPLILLIIPSPIDACDNYDIQIDKKAFPDYERPRLTSIMENIALRNHIMHLNLFSPFRNNDCNDLFYHYGDNHWNIKGQQLAAELMADFISLNNVLK